MAPEHMLTVTLALHSYLDRFPSWSIAGSGQAVDVHAGPVPEAAAVPQTLSRNDRVAPEGYDHLCAGAVTVSSQGLERPWQPGVAAEGNAQQSSSSGLSSSDVSLSPPRDAEGDRPWSGGTKRALGEDTAASGWSQSSRKSQAQDATSACNEAGDREICTSRVYHLTCVYIYIYTHTCISECFFGFMKVDVGHAFDSFQEPFTEAMGAVGQRNAELHGEGTACNVHPVPRRTGENSGMWATFLRALLCLTHLGSLVSWTLQELGWGVGWSSSRYL